MRANFIGRVETNHTAFIRIKTNHEHIQGVLILPVEVEVTSGKQFRFKRFFLSRGGCRG